MRCLEFLFSSRVGGGVVFLLFSSPRFGEKRCLKGFFSPGWGRGCFSFFFSGFWGG